MKKGVIIADMDKTLSIPAKRDHKHPLLFITKDSSHDEKLKLWEEYFVGCSEDEPIKRSVDIIKSLQNHYNIIILTARDETAREETWAWLKKHEINASHLFMREVGDVRPASEVKKENILFIKKYFGEITLMMEDDDRNINVLKELDVPYIKITE